MAGGKSTTFDGELLALFLNGTPIANLADNAASAPLTNLYFSLHTADPGAGGAQNTAEAAYTGYARVPIARTTGGFTISGNTASLAVAVSFAAATGGSETETFFGLGTASSGTGLILYRGTLTPNIVVTTGVIPQLSTGTAITES